jgi:hypothetical protein
MTEVKRKGIKEELLGFRLEMLLGSQYRREMQTPAERVRLLSWGVSVILGQVDGQNGRAKINSSKEKGD